MPRHRFLGLVLGGLLLGGVWAAPVQAQAPALRLSEQAVRLRQGLASQDAAALRRPAAPHYDVVALRVEFQPDTTRFTTGDGTFSGPLYDEGLAPSVDALPHDAGYFQAHLDFLADYVAQVSGGRTRVTTHLVPEVVRLAQQMGAYSPTGFDADSDAERARLAALVEDAWDAASRESAFDLSGFDSERTAFVLFHAGVGRDVELVGTVLDKTPLDLPSLAFDEAALARLGVGGLTFNGFPVRQTLVLPRTETRQGFNFIEDEPFLLELSTNGLLAASFFNYLGVPDLFNTATGESAIGPFGLMDPLGFFAFNGLFPPEPCAWTKYYLGWVDPQELTGDGPEMPVLSAAKTGAPPQTARARISSSEYFLVENRDRDPEGDGLVLRVWKDGVVVEQRVENGTEGFASFDVSAFVGGVVVGVDNYDWALPGGLDEDGNDLNGGILIWHVDERRLADGGVNADPERRALDLEEADSAQDLGFPSGSAFGPNADLGTPFDFFFLDNPVTVITATEQRIRLYENRFGPDTLPNSDSNEGGASFIVLEDFSAPGAEMSFVYRREAAAGIHPLNLNLAASAPALTTVEGSFLNGLGDGAVTGLALRVDQGGLLVTTYDDGDFLETFDYVLTPVVTSDGRVAFLDVGEAGAGLQVLSGPTPVSRTAFDLPPGAAATGRTSVLLYDEANAFFYAFLAGGASKTLLRFSAGGAPEVVALDPVEEPLSVALDGSGRIAVAGRRTAQVVGGTARWDYTLAASDEVGQVVFGRDRSGVVGVVPVLNSLEVLFLRADGSVHRIALSTYAQVIDDEGSLSAYPVLADLDDDGLLDVLTSQGRSLLAFSQNGALLRGFPIDLASSSVAQPLVAELSDSGGWSVVVAATDGYLYAYDLGRAGRQVTGFPLAVGQTLRATPLLQGQELYAVADGGRLLGWQLDNLGAIWWGQHYGDAQNRSFAALTADDPAPQPSSPAGGLIVADETYNWPNPIRAGQTFLRCMTAQDASVRITIVDAAGSLVEEVNMDLRGGTPAEHLWQTDAASGIYYARVIATGPNGETDTRLVKMAVIR